MKTPISMLLGAGLALGASWLLSAASPQGQVYRTQQVSSSVTGDLRPGAILYSLNVMKGTGEGLKGLTPASAVTIRRLEGGWAQVDYPEQPGGTIWVNTQAMVSYSTRR